MEFRLLGLLEVAENGGVVSVGRGRESALLALLLVHANDPLPTDRIVDELWGESPPEQAPKSVQIYVSRLRKALGSGRIETTNAGYLLRVAQGERDLDRFEEHARTGLAELERGNAAAADRSLTAALGIWRGDALADFRFDGFAQIEIRRLDERRQAVASDRIDAWLALGRTEDAIAALGPLVEAAPLHERPRSQLMLALYRAGRQSEALELYRRTRKLFDDELGLEPSPELQELERQILTQDPDLAAPRRPTSVRPRRRGGALVLAGGAVVLVSAAAVAAIVMTRGGGSGVALASVAPGSLAEIDPHTNRVVGQVAVGSGPNAVAADNSSVWVADGAGQEVVEVDGRSHRVRARIPLPTIPTQLALARDALWLTSPLDAARGSLLRVDRRSHAVTSVPVRTAYVADLFAPPTPNVVAAVGRDVWTDTLHADLVQVKDGTGRSFGIGHEHSIDGVAYGAGSLWLTSSVDDSVLRIDPGSGRLVVPPITVASVPGRRAASPGGIAYGFGGVWVAGALDDRVRRIDPVVNTVAATIPVGHRPTDVAVGAGAVWVLNAGDGTVSRIDPETNAVIATIPVAKIVTGIAAGDDRVWVSVGGGSPAPSTPPPRPARSLVTGSCAPLESGGTSPNLIVVSDLPSFDNGGRTNAAIADMRRAVLAVLRERGFHAGGFHIGYQACTDSSPGSSPDLPLCAANAHAYAADPSVVGVVGTYQSICAKVELPTLNAARDGPVAMISPTTTYVGLTHAGPQTEADEPDRYYPTGVRNFVRVSAPDDAQGAGLALFAKQLGRHRLFLLDDGDPTGEAMVTYVTRGARRLGLQVVGTAHWSARGPYKALGERIRRAGADGVVLTGCICTNGGQLQTDLGAVLGPSVPFLVTDNFTFSGDMAQSGAPEAAFRTYITGASAVPQALPATGRAFLRRVFPGRPLTDIDRGVPAAAASMGLLLDAIARSDGTRASVVSQLVQGRAVGTVLGSFAFDANGDPTLAPITVTRISRSAPPAPHLPVGGLQLVRVVDADPGLVAP